MTVQFPKRSTRPLTAESYRRSAMHAIRLAEKIMQKAQEMDSGGLQPAEPRTAMARVIHDLAAHSARLLERHKEQAR